jgi:hypothetical protein
LETEIGEEKILKVKWAVGFLSIVCLSIANLSLERDFPPGILSPTWAQEQTKQIRGTRDSLVVRCELYLMGKTEEGVVVSEEGFRILPSAVILNSDGEKITLRELKVPCLAIVEYGVKADNSAPTIFNLQLLNEPRKR